MLRAFGVGAVEFRIESEASGQQRSMVQGMIEKGRPS